MDKITKYVINLKRRPDRLKYFKNVCPYKDFNIIEAFDGKNINYNSKEIEWFNRISSKSKTLSVPEIACFVSHIKIWEKIVKGKDTYTMIFEDDPIFSKEYKNVERLIDLNIVDSILYFGGRFTPNYIMRNSIPITDVLIKHDMSKRWDPMDCDRTLHGYILTKNCAKILLESFDNIFNGTDPADYYVIRCVLENKMDIYSSKPLLCHSEAVAADSDIR